jgi:hypothetical protein
MRPMPLERPPAFTFDLPGLLSGFRGVYLVNAVVGFLFAASAPVAIILTASAAGRLTEADIASWLFGCFFINGLISLAFCLAYRQPLVFFWTIPGTVLVGQALHHLSFAQVIGAYCVTGLLMLILGLGGWMRKCMDLLPMPIVMAMVAGVFLQFGLNLIFAIRDGFVIAAPMTVVFVLLSAMPNARPSTAAADRCTRHRNCCDCPVRHVQNRWSGLFHLCEPQSLRAGFFLGCHDGIGAAARCHRIGGTECAGFCRA